MNAPLSLPARDGLPARGRPRLLALALGLVVLGGLALAVDIPVARWFALEPLPGELSRFLDLAEFAAHGSGVAALLASLLVFDPGLRPWQPWRPWAFVRMIAAVVAGGLMVDIVKMAVHRVRPRSADLPAMELGLTTFAAAAVGPYGDRVNEICSFPSGHAAVAAATAAALCWRYPHGRPVFVAVALAACLQRIVTGAHYSSDLAVGAALGLVGAAVFLGSPPGETTALVPPRET